jgi:hypothetical protein
MTIAIDICMYIIPFIKKPTHRENRTPGVSPFSFCDSIHSNEGTGPRPVRLYRLVPTYLMIIKGCYYYGAYVHEGYNKAALIEGWCQSG